MTTANASPVVLPAKWTEREIKPHYLQSRAFYAKEKYVGLACGRGSGKSMLAKRRIVAALAKQKAWPDPIYFYALPTFAQAKKVAWRDFLGLVPKPWIKKDGISYTDYSIETIFGSKLYVVGLDKPQRIEGVQWDGGIVDEACDYKPGAFDRSIVPACIHNCDFLWRIGVPKRFGPSAAEYYKWWIKGAEGKADNTFCTTWASSEILQPSELKWALDNLDNSDFQEQYLAKWLSASGGVYLEFDEVGNVSPAAQYCRDLPIYVGCDFNVDPMCWVLGHYISSLDKLLIFDELKIRNTNTQRTLDHLWETYGESHKAGWIFTGDAAARQRKSSADLTDYLLINNDTRFGQKGINFPDSNPSLRSRYSTVNAILRNAAGKRRVLINPKCTVLIDDLKTQSYISGTSEVDKRNKDIGHMADGFGYLGTLVMPIPIQLDVDSSITIIQGPELVA